MHIGLGSCEFSSFHLCDASNSCHYLSMEWPLNIRMLSLGAGVQSSAVLLMADRGDIPPVDFAVFADTGAEPVEVYTWLEKLRAKVSIEIIETTRGNIAIDVVDHFKGRLRRVGQPPLFATDKNGKAGMLRRHCTTEYKIEVVDKAIRERLGYLPRQRMKHNIQVVMGISYDEMQRMKVPQEKWKTFDYPLIDMKLRREDCVAYVEKLGLGTPPRSACVFCPYKTNAEWRRLRDESPPDWELAVEFDRQIRKSVTPGLTSKFFIHRDRVPLSKADLGESDEGHYSMQDECEGMCGV